MPDTAAYDAIADLYAETVGEDVSDPATAALLELVGPVQGLDVLDVACGHGRVTRELARRGARVIGIDVSTELLAMARAIERVAPLGISYPEADVTSAASLPGASFDAVTCNFGLSDIDDLDAALLTIERVLRPGGWFVFSILHPCFPGSGDDAPSSWPPRGYFHEGWWRASNTGFRGKVGSHFRMLSTYLNALIDQGFVLDRVAEPAPPAQHIGTALGMQVPWYLDVRSRKPRR
jgi:ubiquinone/menaquinone biosynthesis C-methylase UbiE